MNKAIFIATAPISLIDNTANNWQATTMNDIIKEQYIQIPENYLFTLGSGISSTIASRATYPSYRLPTGSQYYLAGRDVFRWGGSADPYEIDFDRYGITPDFNRGVAVIWRAPKSEPHHLSEMPHIFKNVPNDWKEICDSIVNKKIDLRK